MFNHKYVSLKQVIDRIKRGRLYKELPYESAIDYGVQAYRLLASEKAEVTKPIKLTISNYRAQLPGDLERILQTIAVDCDSDGNVKTMQAMRYSTGTFHSVMHCFNSPDTNYSSNPKSNYYNSKNSSISENTNRSNPYFGNLTYSLNNNYIVTGFEEGWVLMAYKGLAMDDDECTPLIPDNVNVLLAVEYYIKSRYLDDLGSDDPKVNRQQAKDDLEYCWYIGKAQDSMLGMSMDEYESFANSMSQFFGPGDYHKNLMEGLGTKELIKNQR
tara:strand:+ start:130 stop:942 length:813 start_codon:yes stop_codon:yes gene_type:complete